ncbi:DegT/DnrJ/EryC1/StrS family aminotransferase [Pontimicrobium sp. MEBiC01747]
MKSKIFLSSPHLQGNEINHIKSALDRNELTTGENINTFETNLQSYLNEDVHVACLSSGTAAIHLALVQLGVGLNDEVLCQSFTFSASANPITYQGAKPIFIDSELDTWNMCPIALEEAIKDRIATSVKPKAIIIVHLYGMPAKISELLAVARKYNIPVIEDAAEALGSTYKGRKCGVFGDFSILSFNGNKIITTAGGGALVCKTKKIKEQTIFYATQARDQVAHYEHSKIGYNYRMDNISAGIGCSQMDVLEKYIELRRENNTFYKSLFINTKGVTVFEEFNKNEIFSNHWLSCILIDKKASFTRDELYNKMLENNIETRPLWKPMHLQPVYKEAPYYGSNISERLFKTGLCLPSSSNLTLEERNRILKVINSFKL